MSEDVGSSPTLKNKKIHNIAPPIPGNSIDFLYFSKKMLQKKHPFKGGN